MLIALEVRVRHEDIEMELKDFTGTKVLDAVDFLVEKTINYCNETEDCQVCRFRLNGVVYVAVEDPSDGYRSMMNELTIDNDATMKNVFVGCDVICRHIEKGDYEDDGDILELVDTKTEKVVLRVGTGSCNDYYPYFVAEFDPTAMASNA